MIRKAHSSDRAAKLLSKMVFEKQDIKPTLFSLRQSTITLTRTAVHLINYISCAAPEVDHDVVTMDLGFIPDFRRETKDFCITTRNRVTQLLAPRGVTDTA